jgi:hypothetical protein
MPGFKIIGKIEAPKCQREGGEVKERGNAFSPFVKPPLKFIGTWSYQSPSRKALEGFLGKAIDPFPHHFPDFSQSPVIHLNGDAYHLRWEPIDYSSSKILKEDWVDFKSLEIEGNRVKIVGRIYPVARFFVDGKLPRRISQTISQNAKDFILSLSIEEARRLKILTEKNKFRHTHEFYVEKINI